MPITPDALQKSLAAMNAARQVTHRKMFGGAGFYCDGIFFAVLDDDRLYFKVNDSNIETYEQAGMGPWMLEMNGIQQMPYFEVPPKAWKNADLMCELIDGAVEVAKSKAKSKSKPRKKKA